MAVYKEDLELTDWIQTPLDALVLTAVDHGVDTDSCVLDPNSCELDPIDREKLNDAIRQYLREHDTGIAQHSPDWLAARLKTVGGSTIPTILGLNPYSTLIKFIGERIGVIKSFMDIKPQWGNLFEPVIERFVELKLDTVLMGVNAFIKGRHPGTTYSPDGLCVIDESQICDLGVLPKGSGRYCIALAEFKCPYSRIPDGTVPKYYEPQVKMGLDLLEIPALGIYVEAVFRRCSLEQLKGDGCDVTLVPKRDGKPEQARGVIGFYITQENLAKKQAGAMGFADELVSVENALFGRHVSGFRSTSGIPGPRCDLGVCDPSAFKALMNLVDRDKIVGVWRSEVFLGEMSDTVLDDFESYCASNNYVSIGLMPWKLYGADFHIIQKEDGYLDKHYPVIQEVLDLLKRFSGEGGREYYNKWVADTTGCGFIDAN